MRSRKYQYAAVTNESTGKRGALRNFTVAENGLQAVPNSSGYVADGFEGHSKIELLFHRDDGDYTANGKRRKS